MMRNAMRKHNDTVIKVEISLEQSGNYTATDVKDIRHLSRELKETIDRDRKRRNR